MGVLVRISIFAAILGVFVAQAWDMLFAGVFLGAAAGVAKVTVFATAWTTVTTWLGLRQYDKRAGQLRNGAGRVEKMLDAPKGERKH